MLAWTCNAAHAIELLGAPTVYVALYVLASAHTVSAFVVQIRYTIHAWRWVPVAHAKLNMPLRNFHVLIHRDTLGLRRIDLDCFLTARPYFNCFQALGVNFSKKRFKLDVVYQKKRTYALWTCGAVWFCLASGDGWHTFDPGPFAPASLQSKTTSLACGFSSYLPSLLPIWVFLTIEITLNKYFPCLIFN